MKKISKILITFIIIFLCIFSYSYRVNAVEENIEELEENVEENEKETVIVTYDKLTNETTEVNMDEIKQLFGTRNRTLSYEELYNIPLEDSREHHIRQYFTIPDSARDISISKFCRIDGNLDVYPYKYICKVRATQALNGSGFLVGPNLLLTAAHCVFDSTDTDGDRHYFENWVCYPGYANGTSVKGLSTGWTKAHYVQNWMDNAKGDKNSLSVAEDDWCLLELDDYIGNALPGWIICTSGVTDNTSVDEYGYPLDERFLPNRLHYTSGNTRSVRQYRFYTNAQTTQGMSGGPILQQSDEYAVGITQGVLNSENETMAVNINNTIIDLIVSLMDN